jgi:outer membrane protein assembly factor BamA
MKEHTVLSQRFRAACLELAVVVMCCAPAGPALAQETRAASVEKEVADKAQRLEPYVPGKLERTLIYLEGNNILRRLTGSGDGWYPRLGGLTTGSGFAAGPGIRKHFGRDGLAQISAAGSLKGYWAVDAVARSDAFASKRIILEGRAIHFAFPQERYFGRGIDSHELNRTSYDIQTTGGSVGVLLLPRSVLRGGARLGYAAHRLGPGKGAFPSVETIFSEQQAPGLSEDLDYLTAEAYVEVDYRDFPGNPRSGGYHLATWSNYHDRGDAFSFRRVDVEAMQLFPFLDKRRVIAVRARGAFTDADEGQEVPFYLMPFVGGPETLRGYRERRFTDRNLVLLQAEYRYEILAALDMALFVDAATVAERVQDLSVDEFKTDYGVGFRFGTRQRVMFRFDIGFGGEGTRYFFKFQPAF